MAKTPTDIRSLARAHTDSAVNVTTGNINLKAAVLIDGALHVTKGITRAGAIIDAGGNSNHHTH